jgi:hypothetical protein
LIAAHLSEANNTPELALNALRQALPADHDTALIVAKPDTGTDWIDVNVVSQSA